MRRFLHPIRSRLAGEEGFTLIELMAAIIVLAVGIFSLAQLTSNQLSKSLYTRERDAMIGEANRQIENLRSTSFTNLQLNPSGSIPASYTDDDAVVYMPLVAGSSSSNYVNYQQTATVSPFSFTVKTIIAAVDDSADGTGVADQNSNTVDFKKIILTISAAEQGGFTYKLETIVRDTSNDPIVPVQGFQIQILDTDGNLVNDDTLGWTIDISGAGVEGEDIDEGMYDNFGLQAGTYTCTISNTDSTREWYPNGQPTAQSESFTCVVTAGSINTYQRTWVEPETCDALANQFGDLTVNVTGSDTGLGLSGASVDPAPTGGQTPDPAAQVTGSFGGVTFSQIPTGTYSLTVSMTGYQSKTIDQCVTETAGDPVSVSLTPTVPNPATIKVTVKYTGGGTKTFRVYLSDNIVISQDISKNQTTTFTFTPQPGNYYMHLYCVNGKKENLKESVDPVNPAANQTYYYPGPTITEYYLENKC